MRKNHFQFIMLHIPHCLSITASYEAFQYGVVSRNRIKHFNYLAMSVQKKFVCCLFSSRRTRNRKIKMICISIVYQFQAHYNLNFHLHFDSSFYWGALHCSGCSERWRKRDMEKEGVRFLWDHSMLENSFISFLVYLPIKICNRKNILHSIKA